MTQFKVAVSEILLEIPEDIGQVPDLQGRPWVLIAQGVRASGEREEGDPLNLRAEQVILQPTEKTAPLQETVLDRAVQRRALAMAAKLLRTMRPQLRKLEEVFKDLEGLVEGRAAAGSFVRVVVSSLAATRVQSQLKDVLVPYLMPKAEQEILEKLSALEEDE